MNITEKIRKEINLLIFPLIGRIEADFCKQIDLFQSVDAKYIPRKQEIFRIQKDIAEQESYQDLHKWEYKNSNEDMRVVLLDVLHCISQCNAGDMLLINCHYENIKNPTDFKDYSVKIVLPDRLFDFGHHINPDILFNANGVEYTVKKLIELLNRYVYNDEVIKTIENILENFQKARKVFFDSFYRNYKLPNYKAISDYLDVYFKMVKEISLLISDNGHDLLDFGNDPNLLDFLLNIDGEIDENGDFYPSLFSPFVLNSYFISVQFLASQIYDFHLPENPKSMKVNLTYGLNVDIIVSKIIENFKYSFYYQGERYFSEPLFAIHEQFISGESGDLPVDYILKCTKQSNMQSYNLIEPMRFYTKISSVLQYDLPNVRGTVNIGIFGYVSPFTFDIFTRLIAKALRKDGITVNKIFFTFYRFNDKIPECRVKSKYSVDGYEFKCKYEEKTFDLNKDNIKKLYKNHIVFFLDVYQLYENYMPNEDNFSLNNIREGLYSQIMDKCAVRRNGIKDGAFVNLYKFAEKLNYSRNPLDLSGSPYYKTDTTKINRFLCVFANELNKKNKERENFESVLFFYDSYDSDEEKNKLYSFKENIEHCREEFYDKKYIEVLKVTPVSTSVDSPDNFGEYTLPVSFWQWIKPISSTLHVNMLLLMNKNFKNTNEDWINGKLTDFIILMENLYAVIDYKKISDVKIKFYNTNNNKFMDDFNKAVGLNIDQELLYIIKQLLDYCFNYNDNAQHYVPFNYVNFAMLDMKNLFPTMLYSNCKNIGDILFKYMAANYRSEIRYIDIKNNFEQPYELNFAKANEDKIRYRERKKDYKLMRRLDAFDYLMISQAEINRALRNGIKNILENISATGTRLYSNILKKS